DDLVLLVHERGIRRRLRPQVRLGAGRALGRDGEHFSTGGGEAFVVVAQLREVPAAERSGVPAEEREDDRPAPIRRQRHLAATGARQREVGRRRPGRDRRALAHGLLLRRRRRRRTLEPTLDGRDGGRDRGRGAISRGAVTT